MSPGPWRSTQTGAEARMWPSGRRAAYVTGPFKKDAAWGWYVVPATGSDGVLGFRPAPTKDEAKRLADAELERMR